MKIKDLHVVLVFDRGVVTDELEQTNLMIDNEQSRVVLVKTLPCKCCAHSSEPEKGLKKVDIPEPIRAPRAIRGLMKTIFELRVKIRRLGRARECRCSSLEGTEGRWCPLSPAGQLL
jgi:hypothetical protein